jgi:hypothetical protein
MSFRRGVPSYNQLNLILKINFIRSYYAFYKHTYSPGDAGSRRNPKMAISKERSKEVSRMAWEGCSYGLYKALASIKNYLYYVELDAQMGKKSPRSLAHLHPRLVPHSRGETQQEGGLPTSLKIIWK